jgi:hypothetical protein
MAMRIALRAVLTALAVSVGLILAHVPNIEGVSAVSFFAGYLTGWVSGGVIGGTAMLLLSLLNPLGPAPPPVLAAQVLGMAAVGACGALVRRVAGAAPRAVLAAICLGVLLTAVYDALTNYGVAVSVGRWRDPVAIMIAGAPFAALHIVSNAMIFGATAAVLVRRHPRPERGER